MSFRITAGLLVVLAVLAGVVYVVESQPATPTPTAKTTPVLSFLPSDVAELQASGEGKTVVVARAEESQWLLKQPEEARADRIRVDSLVSRLGTLTASRTIAAPTSLAEYGLDQPKLEARVTLKSGAASTLLVGDQSPDRSVYYARLPDQPTVYLIPAAVGSDLARLLTDPPKATPTPTPFPTLPPAGTPAPAATPAPEATPKPAS